jgi:uncharacterized repeat protein (TIGR01451 family)
MNTPSLHSKNSAPLGAGLIIAALMTNPVSASVLAVNDLGDTTTPGDGLCTLPEAINNAEANSDTTGGDCPAGSGEDIIQFAVSGNVLSGVLPDITDPKGLTIDGSNQEITLGNNAHARNRQGFFTLNQGSVLHLKNLTVSGASGDEHGGAMYNSGGTVTISNCTFSGNFARHAGAIMNYGPLTITDSLFTHNHASRSAGAIRNGSQLKIVNSTFSNNGAGSATHHLQGGGAIENTGDVTIVNSTFSDNRANLGGGGGILSEGYRSYDGVVHRITNITIINSTFTSNIAGSDMTQGGGGIFSGERSKLTVVNSTFTGNFSALSFEGGGGGAIHHEGDFIRVFNSTFYGNKSVRYRFPGPAVGGILLKGKGFSQIANTILADNQGGDCQKAYPLYTNLNNLIKDGSCNPMLTGNPRLGALANNGGPTKTFALLTGSPALETGNDAICRSALVNNRDQRGATRPKGGHCDIGAVEAGFADLSVAIVDTPDPVVVGNQLTWTVKITNSGIVTATGVTLTDQLQTTGYNFIGLTTSQGSCNEPTLSGKVLCNLGNIANGKTATVKLMVYPIIVGQLNNTARVSSNQYDNHLPNNKASQSTRSHEGTWTSGTE